MTREHRRRARNDNAPAGEPVGPGAGTTPGWQADTGRFRRLGSALNWLGDHIAVVGDDPSGAVAEMAATLPVEPQVVTVLSPIDARDDWSVVETVLPIAVPPGSRARVAVPHAAGRDLTGRLARELTATLDAPRADLMLIPGGSMFAVDGWLRHTPDGETTEVGRRSPQPAWESDLDGLCAAGRSGADEMVLVPVPAGIWAFPARPGASLPDLDDPAYGIPMDVDRPVLVIGRPGHPEPTEDALSALLRRLPERLRRDLVLAPYGSATAMVAAASVLAREAGQPVQVRTGLPALTPDGRETSLVIDHSGAVWEPLGTALTVAPTGPARPAGPVRGLDTYSALDDYVFRLNEQWVAEVTASGLWVRSPRQETGAHVVRAHRWMFGRVRIFVGVPGEPPGHDVLPVLGALLARMPVETRRRAELAPARFAVAAGDDGAPDPTTGAFPVPVTQRALLLGQASSTGGRAADRDRTAAVPVAVRPPAPVRRPAPEEKTLVRPTAAGPGAPTSGRTVPADGRPGTSKTRPAQPTVVSTTRQPVPVEGVRQAAPQVVAAPQSPKTPPVAVTGARSGGVTRASDTAGPSTPANVAATERAAAPTGGTETPSEVTKPPVGSIATPGSESRRPIVGHRKRSRRRATPVLAATAVLAVATASGYVLNQNPGQSGGPTAPAAEVALPPESSIDPALPPLPDPFPVDPASADPDADPGSPAPSPSGTVPAASTVEASGTPGSTGSPASPATDDNGRPVAPPPVSRTSDRPAAQTPPPPAATTMPGRVNSSGRNLALGGVANASSVEVNAVWDARYAIDGNTESRWSSAFGSDPQWIAVDLGDVWQVTQVRLLWERAYATAYRVEVSTDGRNWRTVYRTNTGAGGSVTVAVPRSPVRYVRVVGTARVMEGYGYSLHEIEVR